MDVWEERAHLPGLQTKLYYVQAYKDFSQASYLGQVEDGFYVDMVMKPTSAWPSITEPGRVAYLGDSSHVTLLTHQEQNSGNAVHYLIPDNSRGTRSSRSNMDKVENQILAQRGAFLLPPRSISDELVESYFTWVHPIIPVINRARFMRQYRDPKNPPSVLLLQAVFLAGSHIYKATHNENATAEVSVFTFYKRAKALYDANYEDDRIVIVQSLVLLGWYQGGSAEAVESVCDWNRLAIVVAQGCGLHRCVDGSQLSHTDKSLRRRIWWTLFSRDRFTAMSFGRPPCINLEDSDVTMITEQDFVEHSSQRDSRYSLGPQQVQFFLQYVKLSQLAGIILSQHYSVSTLLSDEAREIRPMDQMLADWLKDCPSSMSWKSTQYEFWPALLHLNNTVYSELLK
ncbi:cutinase transcription factor 1 alpha [Fusarium mexicanum]|uniref:Cutinase transcription factor 1 alpha n=1 Tax=Fusarium mexicanum TaxID=751941 RepID=A0A8H5I871_9HYPO|nr:cutinase transcription factor 1 alpha [Fusarium mexicanum]